MGLNNYIPKEVGMKNKYRNKHSCQKITIILCAKSS